MRLDSRFKNSEQYLVFNISTSVFCLSNNRSLPCHQACTKTKNDSSAEQMLDQPRLILSAVSKTIQIGQSLEECKLPYRHENDVNRCSFKLQLNTYLQVKMPINVRKGGTATLK